MNDDNINDIKVSKGVGNILFGLSNGYSINQIHSKLWRLKTMNNGIVYNIGCCISSK